MKQTLKEHVEDHLRILKKQRKLPEITVSEWLEAEREVGLSATERPHGSVTIDEYAKMTGRLYRTAQTVLKGLVDRGKARRVDWYRHRSLYVLVNNGSKK